jgi:hypothetical protein
MNTVDLGGQFERKAATSSADVGKGSFPDDRADAASLEGASIFEVTVSDPEKKGEGMYAYVTYKVNTKVRLRARTAACLPVMVARVWRLIMRAPRVVRRWRCRPARSASRRWCVATATLRGCGSACLNAMRAGSSRRCPRRRSLVRGLARMPCSPRNAA